MIANASIESLLSPAPASHCAGTVVVGVHSEEMVAMAAVIVIVVVVLILLLGLWAAYNTLVKKRNRTQEAWSEIDVELKRRHDLIPNLVSTVEGYASHERGTFEAVTAARANAVSAGATGDPTKIAPGENALPGALRSR